LVSRDLSVMILAGKSFGKHRISVAGFFQKLGRVPVIG
jgi:hypothetical protein